MLFAGVVNATSVNFSKEQKNEDVKDHLENHFKLYGFIRNYLTYNSRESVDGTQDLFYYRPFDEKFNALGEDLNEMSSVRFMSLTTRLGLNVSGYKIGKTNFGAKIETDFYCMNGVTATLRLRQAYLTLGWDNLSHNSDSNIKGRLLVGQTWHPFAVDMPSTISLEVGAPFNPFSRTPMIAMDTYFSDNFSLTAAALWQMQYLSTGPKGNSTAYLNYSCIPELYLGLTYKTGGFKVKTGVDFLSIKPRTTGEVESEDPNTLLPLLVERKVSDRLNTLSSYIYLEYKKDKFSINGKSTYGASGEHMSLFGGYVISNMVNKDGHYDYTPINSSSNWLHVSYGKKLKWMMLLGYYKNLGTKAEVKSLVAKNIFFNKNGAINLNSMYRIEPAVSYDLGKFTIGLEYNYTAAQFGDGLKFDSHALSTDGLHWVGNHRIQTMIKFTF